MNCPRCPEGPTLVETVKHGVTLDTCAGCGGIWLDRGELGKLLNQVKAAGSELDREFQALQPRHPGSHPGQPYKRPKSKMERLFDIFD
ncbi:MAG: zf-TFIIB domain-containing protein [Thermodesulfobacteriota bacterium]